MQVTLANLKDATAQQVFDQVKNHMLAQGKQSKNGDVCAYRGEGGLMCAAGCLFSDDEYTKLKQTEFLNLEDNGGKNWGWLADNSYVPNVHERLISELQAVHDFNEPEKWASQLEKVAISSGLE